MDNYEELNSYIRETNDRYEREERDWAMDKADEMEHELDLIALHEQEEKDKILSYDH